MKMKLDGQKSNVFWNVRCKEHNSEMVAYTSKVQMSLKMINDDN